jgi:hypothetical protein
MAIRIEAKSIDDLNCEGLALGFFSDEKPPRGYSGFVDWRLNGIISRYMAEGRLEGSYLEKVLIASNRRIPPSKVLLIGLGELSSLTYDTIYTAGYQFSETIAHLKWGDCAFEIPAAGRCGLALPIMAEAVLTGFFDAFSKDIGQLESLSPVLLIRENFIEPVLAGAERFRKNINYVIPVEMAPIGDVIQGETIFG